MARCLIEAPHEAEMVACARAVQLLLQTGSHSLTHADFGCRDDDHRAWIVVDTADKEEARGILPPAFCGQARITELDKFSLAELKDLLEHHRG